MPDSISSLYPILLYLIPLYLIPALLYPIPLYLIPLYQIPNLPVIPNSVMTGSPKLGVVLYHQMAEGKRIRCILEKGEVVEIHQGIHAC